jgi:hypothetical protein
MEGQRVGMGSIASRVNAAARSWAQGQDRWMRSQSRRCPRVSRADVEQSLAQRLGFGLGQVAVQQQVLGPGEQVDGEHDHCEPAGVDRERPRGEVAQAGVLRGADVVLDSGVGAVAGVEVRELVLCQNSMRVCG